jgi:hypothetical protein
VRRIRPVECGHNKGIGGEKKMTQSEHIDYLKSQLEQTQRWMENGSELRSEHIITMIIRGMIDTENQIENLERG